MESTGLAVTRRTWYQIISPPYSFSSYLGSIWSVSKTGLVYGSALIATLSASIYAFSLPLGISPEKITLDLWNALPFSAKAMAIGFATIGLGIGTLMRVNHIPSFVKKLHEIFSHFCQSELIFLKNNFVLTMSTLTAVASLSLAYYGFLWLGIGSAMSIAAINFLITLGMRAESVDGLIEKTKNLFDKDYQFQKAIINELKYLKPEHVAYFDNYIKQCVEEGNPLTEETVLKCLIEIYDKAHLSEEQHLIPIFSAPTLCSQINKTLRFFANAALGIIFGTSFFIFSAQNGYEGYRVICLSAFENCDMDKWSYYGKLALAISSGLSSFALAYLSGDRAIDTAYLLREFMMANKKNALISILVITGSAISALSLMGAAKVLSIKPNLFGILPNSAKAYCLMAGCELMGATYDIQAILNLLTKNEVSYLKATNWLEKNKLSPASIRALRDHSYFKKHETTPLLICNKENNDVEIDMSHEFSFTYV